MNGRPPSMNGYRRRPSRGTFVVRRLIVLLVVAAVVTGIVVVAKSALKSDKSDAVTTSTLASDTTLLDSATTLPSAVLDPSAASSTTIAGAVGAARVPTAADPARVLLVGDSEAGGLSPFLGNALKPFGLTTLDTDYKVSTGLVRNDYYDWPAHLQETLPGKNPEIVIALFGGNDGQPFIDMPNNPVSSPEWQAEYGKRVGAMMDFLGGEGRSLIWVGVPNAASENLTAALSVQNEVVKQQVALRPSVIFVDSWKVFIGLDGKSFASQVLDPRDGQFKAVRSTKDNFHLNNTGEEILAVYVSSAVLTALQSRGAIVG
jgi:hypothetical protein